MLYIKLIYKLNVNALVRLNYKNYIKNVGEKPE